ncbi:MAG TPA: diguanylate cyclase [Baekduia sp.]|nr:diguanylate cyclase [Baekduia sp.]
MNDPRARAYSAAGIYAGATTISLVEAAIPGKETASIGPGLLALVMIPILLVLGPRLPSWLVFLAGPLGVAGIGWALATTHGFGDGAVLYVWPVLWTTAFFGIRGALAIVVWIAVVHAVALMVMPEEQANLNRWLDVVASVGVVATVVHILVARNDRLIGRLASEARSDPLTGLLNRRGLQERFDVELAWSARDHRPLALVVFDIDGFKLVNDLHGHEVGDRVLRLLGAVLTSEARATDIVARTGGEEFTVALSDTGEAEALGFAERVRTKFASTTSNGRQEYGIPSTVVMTLSAGVACAVGDIEDHALAESADKALYAAKRAGRNRSVAASAMEQLGLGPRPSCLGLRPTPPPPAGDLFRELDLP